MRAVALFGLALLCLTRHAGAESPEPTGPPIELGPAPPPPPGAVVVEPDEPPLPDELPPPAPTQPAPPPAPPPPALEPRPVDGKPPAPGASTPPGAARADVPSAPRHEGTAWYGWQILITDGSALVLYVAGSPILGGGAYFLAPPSIHLGHKQGLAALGSIALRIGLPLGATAVASGLGCPKGDCAVAVPLAGALGASLIDVVWLSSEPARKRPNQASVAPGLAADRNGVAFSLTGRF